MFVSFIFTHTQVLRHFKWCTLCTWVFQLHKSFGISPFSSGKIANQLNATKKVVSYFNFKLFRMHFSIYKNGYTQFTNYVWGLLFDDLKSTLCNESNCLVNIKLIHNWQQLVAWYLLVILVSTFLSDYINSVNYIDIKIVLLNKNFF